MAPPRTPSSASTQQDKWVNVTWMPHTTLSQTSHVCLMVRSAHATLDPLLTTTTSTIEWTVRIGTYAIGGLPLVPIQSHTPGATLLRQADNKTIRPAVDSTHACNWDAFVQIPLRWRDLPRDAYLKFEVLRRDAVVYEATMPFFSLYGRLATGLQKVELVEPSAASAVSTRNLGVHDLRQQQQQHDEPVDETWQASCILDQLGRFEERKSDNKNQFGQVPSVKWLDGIQRERARTILATAQSIEVCTLPSSSRGAFLIFEFPDFDIPITHEETFYPTPQLGASGAVTPLDLAVYRSNKKKSESTFNPLELVQFLDYENENDNPVEDKYRTLAHDLLRGLVDPALKPDREQRDRLAAIIDSTSHHPTREEKDLLWRFRFSLVDNRRALTKFLLAVDWTVESEVVQAAELLEQWRKRSPIEVTDALKLLGKHVAFQTNLVRSYAIDTLAAAPDSELRLYLLQLVQALKYENEQQQGQQRISSLGSFLIERAAGNIELANFLYWYVKVELDNPTHGARYRQVFDALQAKLSRTPFQATKTSDKGGNKSLKSIVDKIGTSLLLGAEKEKGDRRTMWDVLVAQDEFIAGLLAIQKQCFDVRGKKDAKEEQLQLLLAKENYDRDPNRSPIPLPSAPEILVNGVNPSSAKIFKSALYPALVTFHVEAKKTTSAKYEEHCSTFKVIVKTGDDLRQDQLIMMMIQLMDGLLKRAALDLCLTPYSILATSATSGLVEFVEGSMPISGVLSQHNGSVLQFFRAKAPQPGAKYDVNPSVMSTYVRSLAGYCVITYILGVGDRHLDNILLCATGHFFHIDFGFIFGRDPKPLPPVFRLTREMVDGMGGVESAEYRQFCSLACQAFNALRKSAGLVLNLLYLMSDAGIEDLSNNPMVADAEGVIAKVEERFRLDLTDEQAERYFVGLVNDCLAALAPRVMDVFHSFAVARR